MNGLFEWKTSLLRMTLSPGCQGGLCCSDQVRHQVLMLAVWRDSDQSGQGLCGIKYKAYLIFAQHIMAYKILPHSCSYLCHA